MLTLDNFESLRRRVADLQKERDRAAGAREEILRQLTLDFGVKDLAAAEKLLARLQKERTKAYNEYAAKKKSFEEEWAEILEE